MAVEQESESDKVLVKRVQQGDKRAFDLLVLKYQHKILILVSRYVNDNGEIQDITQEAFIKAYRALPNFRGESGFYTWLYRIAINTAKNHLVSRGRRPPATDVDIDNSENYEVQGVLKDSAGPEELLHRDEVQSAVFSAIKQLPEDLRVAVTLRELEGLSYEDIAEVMDCPVGTVRSRIFRAREAIDKKVMPMLERTTQSKRM